jgi:translation elongation factor EF-1alpha
MTFSHIIFKLNQVFSTIINKIKEEKKNSSKHTTSWLLKSISSDLAWTRVYPGALQLT